MEKFMTAECAGPVFTSWRGTAEMKAAWEPMRDAAKLFGLDLVPTFGFRTMTEQTKLFEERMDRETDPPHILEQKERIRALKGIAARPGYSLHQSGRALDLKTGLTAAAFRRGERSPVFLWLEANAPKYGWAVLRVKSEPWHLELVVVAS
jgi:D-alanyl-D-alanine carboxypeptidase